MCVSVWRGSVAGLPGMVASHDGVARFHNTCVDRMRRAAGRMGGARRRGADIARQAVVGRWRGACGALRVGGHMRSQIPRFAR